MKYILTIMILLTATLSQAQDRVQLKDYRARFIDQRIIINGSFTSTPSVFLSNWQFVKARGGVYEPDYSKTVPVSFIGRSGVIIAVQAPVKGRGLTADQSDDVYVQYGEAIVKVDSGELIQTALFNVYLSREPGSEPSDAFTLASVRERHKREAFALAQQLTGKSLYLTRLTSIYDMGLSLANIETLKAGVGYSEAKINDAPLLTPIPVVETRYSEARDFTLVVLQLPGAGRRALYVLGCIADTLTPKDYACASTSMVSFLSKQEVEAIRESKVFVGMSEIALHMAMDFPRETSKAAVGLTQLVYGTAYIYLDQDKKVVEIQSRK